MRHDLLEYIEQQPKASGYWPCIWERSECTSVVSASLTLIDKHLQHGFQCASIGIVLTGDCHGICYHYLCCTSRVPTNAAIVSRLRTPSNLTACAICSLHLVHLPILAESAKKHTGSRCRFGEMCLDSLC